MLRQLALEALLARDTAQKVSLVQQLGQAWDAGQLALDTQWTCAIPCGIPGLPEKPELVLPKFLPRRAMHTAEGRACAIHALTHIEFNAINLALDAIWRFAGLPPDFYTDWLRVAREEAYHFTLLETHLHSLGYTYGAFVGHSSLWEMAEKTKGNVLARMALVPRTLEARGLDATPAMRAKLAQAGDQQAAAILDIILRDEIGHVAIGNFWFAKICNIERREPLATWQQMVIDYNAPALRPPFNLDARRAAGFTEAELVYLQAAAGRPQAPESAHSSGG